jgi:hypothetical protein
MSLGIGIRLMLHKALSRLQNGRTYYIFVFKLRV